MLHGCMPYQARARQGRERGSDASVPYCAPVRHAVSSIGATAGYDAEKGAIIGVALPAKRWHCGVFSMTVRTSCGRALLAAAASYLAATGARAAPTPSVEAWQTLPAMPSLPEGTVGRHAEIDGARIWYAEWGRPRNPGFSLPAGAAAARRFRQLQLLRQADPGARGAEVSRRRDRQPRPRPQHPPRRAAHLPYDGRGCDRIARSFEDLASQTGRAGATAAASGSISR